MLTQSELLNRHTALKLMLEEQKLAGAVFFNPINIQYFTNFIHLSTERPIVLVISVDGPPLVLLPKLEQEHFEMQAPWFSDIFVYPEYPGKQHPMLILENMLTDHHLSKLPLGVDHDGYINQNGYNGPTLSSLLNKPLVNVHQWVNQLRLIKSEAEITHMRESGRWASITHQHLFDSIKIGQTERGISRIAEEAAYTQLGTAQKTQPELAYMGLHASFRSGTRTSMSHASMGGRVVGEGDAVVTYCQGIYSGYTTELERTMFVGEPGQLRAELLDTVIQAQARALEIIMPGVPCSEVDAVIKAFFAAENQTDHMQHHQGHGLGLEFHEAPFLDLGDSTILEAGMIVSVEPGLYVEGLGGFRHSDTVLVTETGYEILTPFPSQVKELIIEP